MTLPRARRLLAVIGVVPLLLVAGLVSSPSSAASHAGELRIKGPGTLYSGNGAVVSEAVAAGTTDKFELLVVNTGSTLAQYNIKVSNYGLLANVDLFAGTLVLSPLSSSPDGYYTAPIAPGKSQALTLKVAIPSGSPQGSAVVSVSLQATDGTYLGSVTSQTEVKAPTYGTTDADVFAKQGSQPYIGGSVNGQIATAPAINVGGSAVFTVKLQNDGSVPASVGASMYTASDCSAVVVKDGTVDITTAMQDGTYSTPVLGVHAARTLKVTFTRTSAAGCGPYDYVYVQGYGTVSHYTYTLVPYPAT